MYKVSERFLEALKHSHTLATKCEVYEGNLLLAELQVSDGNVNVDKRSSNRRRCDVTLHTTSLVPTDVDDVLHPVANRELRLYRGIAYDTDDVELVPLGRFGIEDVDVEDTGEELSIRVKGFDKSKDVQRRRFTGAYVIARGTNYAVAIRELINTVMPGLTYNFPVVDFVTPQMVFGLDGWSGGGDVWEKASEMAASIGMELFFDANGALVLRPEPDPTVDPVVAEYEEGPKSTLLHVSRGISRENVYNHVVAYGGQNSDADTPVRVDAYDNNPSSPTYYLGPFGDVPFFFRSTFVLTTAQAQAVADAQLRKLLGTPETIQFISIVNPAHEVGDSVRVRRDRVGVNAVHVLDKLNIPLKFNVSMNASARERRV